MKRRAFGRSGIEVSVLGLGAGALGDPALSEGEVERLLKGALDHGVNLVDTARSYGLSEERIGRHLGARRRDVVLSTKGGYGIEGTADWTGEAITRGIDDALRRLATDFIDVYHLHSCPKDTLAREEILGALDRARAAGKIRVAAYSGENDALAFAADSGRFGGLQCSVNVFDQRSLAVLERASASGVGVIAKRPLGNCPWRFDERPVGDYAEVYWERMRAMRLDPSPAAWVELAARFSAFAPGVSSIIIGTARLQHLDENARLVARGPLAADVCAGVRASFAANDSGWLGQI